MRTVGGRGLMYNGERRPRTGRPLGKATCHLVRPIGRTGTPTWTIVGKPLNLYLDCRPGLPTWTGGIHKGKQPDDVCLVI